MLQLLQKLDTDKNPLNQLPSPHQSSIDGFSFLSSPSPDRFQTRVVKRGRPRPDRQHNQRTLRRPSLQRSAQNPRSRSLSRRRPTTAVVHHRSRTSSQRRSDPESDLTVTDSHNLLRRSISFGKLDVRPAPTSAALANADDWTIIAPTGIRHQTESNDQVLPLLHSLLSFVPWSVRTTSSHLRSSP